MNRDSRAMELGEDAATDRVAQLARIYNGFDVDRNGKVSPGQLAALAHQATHREYGTEWSMGRNDQVFH